MNYKSQSYVILVISLCGWFLFYKYILQIYPSVVTDDLMREFNLTGAGLGNLAATFYYSYMIAQLFVGYLLDRYSPRWLSSIAILLCAIGLLIFSQTNNLYVAQLSRALMGIGVAFATVTYMKLSAAWCKPQHYAFVSGLLATAAMAGAVFGQAPLAVLISFTGWRTSLFIVSIIGLLLALAFAVLVRDQPEHHISSKHSLKIEDFIKIFKSKENWLLMFYSGLSFSPIVIFGGLWGNPFLQNAYQVSHSTAAFFVSLTFIGLGLGSPILGYAAEVLQSKKWLMFICTLISCIALSIIIYFPVSSLFLLGTLLFIFGFFLGAFMIVFTIGKEINPLPLVGSVVAMINMSEAILESFAEPAIGKILDLTWSGDIINGVHMFSVSSYQIAFLILPAYLFLSLLCLLPLRMR